MVRNREDGGLIWRLPRTPRALSSHQRQEVRERLQRGERAAGIAYAFGIDDVNSAARQLSHCKHLGP
jgi:hypothetical protein